MTLRQKTLTIIGLTLIGLVVVLYLTFQAVMMGGFRTIEQREASRNVARVKDALLQELDNFNRTAGDYAHWDDTYAFVDAPQQDYLETNFNANTYSSLDIDLVLLLNLADEAIYAAEYNPNSGLISALGPGGVDQVLAQEALLLPGVESGSVSGLIYLERQPLMVVSQPILNSQLEGPRKGTLIFARFLDAAAIQKLETLTQVSIEFYQWDALGSSAELVEIQDMLSAASPVAVQPLNAQLIAGYTYLEGVAQQPVMLIRVDVPRDVYQQGLSSLGYLMASVAVVGVVYGGLIWWLLSYWVVNPVSNLSANMAQIGNKADLSVRLPVVGKDEISSLGKVINAMLASLQQRTQEHERFLNRVNLASEASRLISASFGSAVSSTPKMRLDEVVEFIRARFDYYFVGLYLLDDAGHYAVLQAATGDVGRRSVQEKYRLTQNDAALVWRAISTQRPRVISDIDPDYKVVRFSHPGLPLTRSELALPLNNGRRIVGALSLQASRPNAFGAEDIVVLSDVANDLAAALENIRLFQQVSANLDEIQSLHRKYLIQSWSEVTRTVGTLRYTFENDQVFAANPSPGAISVPIILRDQEIGRITLETEQESLTPEQAAFVETVTTQAALALESARLLEQTQSSAAQERTLTDMMQKVRSSTNVDTILQTAIGELGRTLRAAEAVIELDLGGQDVPIQAQAKVMDMDMDSRPT